MIDNSYYKSPEIRSALSGLACDTDLRRRHGLLPGNSLWAWEFYALKRRFCLSQTLWNPES